MKTKTKLDIIKPAILYVVRNVDTDVFVDIACALYGFEYRGYTELLLPVHMVVRWSEDGEEAYFDHEKSYDFMNDLFQEIKYRTPNYIILSV
jgi:hypothetical protein